MTGTGAWLCPEAGCRELGGLDCAGVLGASDAVGGRGEIGVPRGGIARAALRHAAPIPGRFVLHPRPLPTIAPTGGAQGAASWDAGGVGARGCQPGGAGSWGMSIAGGSQSCLCPSSAHSPRRAPQSFYLGHPAWGMARVTGGCTHRADLGLGGNQSGWAVESSGLAGQRPGWPGDRTGCRLAGSPIHPPAKQAAPFPPAPFYRWKNEAGRSVGG